MSLIFRTTRSALKGTRATAHVRMYAGDQGGGAGSIRKAGGAFGKMEAAREDQYFYNKQKEQIKNLKGHLDKEITFHQEQIQRHEDAIKRHKNKLQVMNTSKRE